MALASALKPLERVQRLVLAVMAVLFTLVVGWMDVEVGARVSFWLLYLMPIAVVSWFLGPRLAVAIAALGGTLALSAQVGEALPDAGGLAAASWNLASLAVLFAVAALIPTRVQRMVLEQSRLARQDLLTLIPNRRSFNERLPLELSAAADRRAPITVGLVEVHGIAYVNERYGTRAGDLLLRATADALRRSIGKNDLIGRVGGTTFAVVLPGKGEDAARAVLESVREQVLCEIKLYDRPISVAIAAVSTARASPVGQELLDRTDWLLHSIKQDRKLHPFRVIGEHEIQA